MTLALYLSKQEIELIDADTGEVLGRPEAVDVQYPPTSFFGRPMPYMTAVMEVGEATLTFSVEPQRGPILRLGAGMAAK